MLLVFICLCGFGSELKTHLHNKDVIDWRILHLQLEELKELNWTGSNYGKWTVFTALQESHGLKI
jgi:hypothetical protein